MIDVQLETPFESPSDFRDAVSRLLGQAPAQLAQNSALKTDWIATPLGPLIAVSDAEVLHLLEFIDRKALPTELKKLQVTTETPLSIGRFFPIDQIESELFAFFAGRRAEFDTPVKLHGSPFTQRVWEALWQIPVGTTRSYREIARSIGRPTAVRAVARANGANQLAIAVPCHRVIGTNGSLTGYGGGLWRKQKLIEIEQDLVGNLRMGK